MKRSWFAQIRYRPGRCRLGFVVALLLMRRKRLKFEEARVDGEREILHLRDSRTHAEYEVLNPRLADDEMTAVHEEVFRVLGWK